MKARVTHSVLLVLALSGAAHATDSTQTMNARQDKAVGIGMGTGVLVGAIIGGPIGAVAAGMLGAVMGDNVVKTEALEDTRLALASSQLQLSRSDQALASADASIEDMRSRQRAWGNIQSAIQFKTGSAILEPAYVAQLNKLADVLRQYPTLFIELSGYADSRGDETYNMALSDQRASSVKAYLIKRGVNSEQLLTTARGEMESEDTSMNPEILFFDRKVVMTLRNQQDALTASQ